MMIRALALDDEPPALQVLSNFCANTEGVILLQAFTRPAELLDYLSEHPVDLLFLDINMPSVNGLSFYRAIPQKIPVIFTTAYSEYAVESYEVNAMDYLLKPFSLNRFQQAINKVKSNHAFSPSDQSNSAQKSQYLTLRVEYSLIKVNFKDILYIEALDNYLKVQMVNEDRLITRMTIKSIREKLLEQQFIQVHRSFIVALEHTEGVRNRIITLKNGQNIPLGRYYEKGFLSHFTRE